MHATIKLLRVRKGQGMQKALLYFILSLLILTSSAWAQAECVFDENQDYSLFSKSEKDAYFLCWRSYFMWKYGIKFWTTTAGTKGTNGMKPHAG